MVMATAVKLEKERRSLRDELEICQKRQWDLDSRELGLKQREHACAKAVELYHMREDGRGSTYRRPTGPCCESQRTPGEIWMGLKKPPSKRSSALNAPKLGSA